MDEKPIGIVCLKWDYRGFHFHEHADFTDFFGWQGAEWCFQDLLARARNAVTAIDDGSMPDLATADDVKDIITPELQIQLDALDQVRAPGDVARLLRDEGLDGTSE